MKVLVWWTFLLMWEFTSFFHKTSSWNLCRIAYFEATHYDQFSFSLEQLWHVAWTIMFFYAIHMIFREGISLNCQCCIHFFPHGFFSPNGNFEASRGSEDSVPSKLKDLRIQWRLNWKYLATCHVSCKIRWLPGGLLYFWWFFQIQLDEQKILLNLY